jgi:hypothetical protein
MKPNLVLFTSRQNDPTGCILVGKYKKIQSRDQSTILTNYNIYLLNLKLKENLSNFEVPQIRTGSKKRTNLSLAKKVEAKVADFDIRGAVKLLSSDDSLASFNEDVAEELKKNVLHHLANFFSQTLPNQETLV